MNADSLGIVQTLQVSNSLLLHAKFC